jgi:hypothetical protein
MIRNIIRKISKKIVIVGLLGIFGITYSGVVSLRQPQPETPVLVQQIAAVQQPNNFISWLQRVFEGDGTVNKNEFSVQTPNLNIGTPSKLWTWIQNQWQRIVGGGNQVTQPALQAEKSVDWKDCLSYNPLIPRVYAASSVS